MSVCEPLPNDGADFKCGRKVAYDNKRLSFTCDRKAVRALTLEAWELLDDMFVWRACCEIHATEAAIELGE